MGQVLELAGLLVRLKRAVLSGKPFLVGGAPLERGAVTRGSFSLHVAFCVSVSVMSSLEIHAQSRCFGWIKLKIHSVGLL